jgi:hypothetical protein
MPNSATNLKLLGAAEGSWFGATDKRYVCSFANSNSGLSFGISQFDVSVNGTAKSIFRNILSTAVAAKSLTAITADDLYRKASAGNGGALFVAAEIQTINGLLGQPNAKSAIDANDLTHANERGGAAGGAIDGAFRSWTTTGKLSVADAGLTPIRVGSNAYLSAYGYVMATLNKRPDNVDAISNFLKGDAVKLASGTVFDLTAPPTSAEIETFLSSLKAWTGINGRFSYLQSRMDPVIAAILQAAPADVPPVAPPAGAPPPIISSARY